MNQPTGAQRLLKGMRDLPALPQVVAQVLDLLQSPNSTGAQIARLVQYDPGLASRILRMVNSSAYGIPRQVVSIQHAIAMLGFRAVHGLVLGASVCQILGKEQATAIGALDVNEFWQHSLMTAFLAKHIAELYRLPDSDEIFGAGMLHNIGVLAIHTQALPLDKDLHAALKKASMWRYHPHAVTVEDHILGFRHTHVGVEIAERWNLPELIQNVMAHYLTPQERDDHTDAAIFCVSLAHYLLAALHTSEAAPGLQHIPEVLSTYFSLDTHEDIQSLCEHVPLLTEESQEIMQLFT